MTAFRCSLFPAPFVHWYNEGHEEGRFEAVALFVDIAGFTSLTETLVQHHEDGIETLTAALASVFQSLVHAVYAQGGFIVTFAGDAFTALFPLRTRDEPSTTLHALHTAMAVQQHFIDHSILSTPYGSFEFGVRVGIGMGAVEWSVLAGTPRADGHAPPRLCFARGSAIERCAAAEHAATRGEIVASPETESLLPDVLHIHPKEEGYLLLPMQPLPDLPLPPPQPPLPPDLLQPFVPPALFDLAASTIIAEFREVAAIFLAFADPPDAAALRAFATLVIDTADHYGGYVNKIDSGDKGGLFVLLFGAPVAHEHNLHRAADFLLALQASSSSLSWKAGLTWGLVYAGFLGGNERCEYTAIGDVMNLAARLMARAPWYATWVGPLAAEHLRYAGYDVPFDRTVEVKGKRDAIDVSRLVDKPGTTPNQATGGHFIGRAEEMSRIQQWLAPLAEGRSAGVLRIDGEAGVGKSHLVDAMQPWLTRDDQVQWLWCPTNDTLRHSLHPLQRALRHICAYDPLRPEAENRQRFDVMLQSLIDTIQPDTPALAREVERTRTFLAVLVGLKPDPLYAQLDPPLRFENTLQALVAFCQASSLQRPLVVQIEDIQWLDTDTHTLLTRFTREGRDFPIAIICTGRYANDGSLVPLHLDEDIPLLSLELHSLGADEVRQLAGALLDSPISDDLALLLWEKTQGNPFFVEQLVLEMQQQGMLVCATDGSHSMAVAEIARLPTSITAVLVARLDRLTALIKQTVQTAAVLGQEFVVQVLTHMLREDEEQAMALVRQAEQAQIWALVSEARYLFRHALLRDTAYRMQLRTRLRELHELAAQAIEQVFAANLTPYYTDLAYHYGRAGLPEHERPYARLASEELAERYDNEEALHYLARALELTPEDDIEERYVIVQRREQIYHLQGNREAQQVELAALAVLAEQIDSPTMRAQVALRQADYWLVLGEYAQAQAAAQQAIAQVEQHAAYDGFAAQGHLLWGRALRHQGAYDEALVQMERARDWAKTNAHTRLVASALREYGTVAFFQGDYTTARTYDEQALQHFQTLGDQQEIARTLDSIGSDISMGKDRAAAIDWYKHALAIYEQVGCHEGISLTLCNLGDNYRDCGMYGQALTVLEQGLELSRAVRSQWSEGFFLGCQGWLLLNLGAYEASAAAFAHALAVVQAIEDQSGVAWVMAGLSVLTRRQGRFAEAEKQAQQVIDLALVMGERTREGEGWLHQGDVLAAMGKFDEAQTCYASAQAAWEETEQTANVLEVLAAQAQLALRRGNIEEAYARVMTILETLSPTALAGADDPLRVYLACYEVLAARGDSRVRETLQVASTLLHKRAATLPDEALRESYLHRVETNRLILAAAQQLEEGE
jgi:predicted ATPase/class 3 adenylate cyclase